VNNPTPYIEQLNKLRFLMLEVYKSEKSRSAFNRKLHSTASTDENPYELLDYNGVLRFIDTTVTMLVTKMHSPNDNWKKKLKFCNTLYKITMDEKRVQDVVHTLHNLIKNNAIVWPVYNTNTYIRGIIT